MAHRARILYLLWAGELGGAERHVYDLATALPLDRFAPTVCFLSKASVIGGLLTKAGVPVVEMGLRNGRDLNGALRFVRWQWKNQFDLVHDHVSTPWTRVAVGLSALHTPIVSTEHSTIWFEKYPRWQRWWGRLSAYFTNYYIAVSKAARSVFVAAIGIRGERILVIPNFIDSSRFMELSAEKVRGIKHSLGIPESATILISIGRLSPEKGFDRLIQSLVPVFRTCPELHLLIVGEGPSRETLTEAVKLAYLQDRIHILGTRLDVAELLGASDIFVLASRLETFGIVAAEAMMAGIPVVASNIPGLNEVVESGQTGFLIPENRLEADFADAVVRLLDDPELRRRMGESGRQRALALFERQKVVSQIIDLYQELLGQKGTK